MAATTTVPFGRLAVTMLCGLALLAAGAAGQDASDTSEPAIPERLRKAAAASFVTVHFTFQKDPSPDSDDAAPDSYAPSRQRMYQQYIDLKMTMDVVGVVIAPGEIMIADRQINPRCVKAVEVRTLAGKAMPATLGELMRRCDAVTVKVARAHAGKLTPMTFAPRAELSMATDLLRVGLDKVEDKWRLIHGTLKPTPVLRTDKKPWLLFGRGFGESHGALRYLSPTTPAGMGGPGIIADEDGNPIGVTCAGGLDSREFYGCWVGATVLNAPRVALAGLPEYKRKLRGTLLKAVHEVTVQFRQGGGGGGGDEFGASSRFGSRGPSGLAGREVTVFGVAVSDKRIFIPKGLDRKVAAQLDAMYVKFSAGRRARAKFLGAYKDFGGMLIELTSGTLPVAVPAAPKLPDRHEPFWIASARKRYAAKHVDLRRARLSGRRRGFANGYHWRANATMKSGDLLFDYRGRLFGVVLNQRIEDEEQRRVADPRAGSYSYGRSDSQRIFLLSELQPRLASPDKHFDTKIVVKSRLAARRRSWLGVEFVTLSPDVAEQMKVAKPTKDGSVGLLINAVYPNSPAAAIGLREGDILLRVAVGGKTDPIELKAGRGRYVSRYDSYPRFGGNDSGEGPAERTWKARENFLTTLLDAIGVGTKITVTSYRPAGEGKGAEQTAEVTVTMAPPDISAARRWKNRKIGLSVRDLTYEVRQALTLKPSAPGVVLVKTEPGSPASIARIWPNEIITHADGKPLSGAWDLHKAIAAAKAANAGKVRLAVLRLGKSRFADLKIDAYNPDDDEGLDEDYE